MLRDDEMEALKEEAYRQSKEYEDHTTVSDVIRQCIRTGLGLDDQA